MSEGHCIIQYQLRLFLVVPIYFDSLKTRTFQDLFTTSKATFKFSHNCGSHDVSDVGSTYTTGSYCMIVQLLLRVVEVTMFQTPLTPGSRIGSGLPQFAKSHSIPGSRHTTGNHDVPVFSSHGRSAFQSSFIHGRSHNTPGLKTQDSRLQSHHWKPRCSSILLTWQGYIPVLFHSWKKS